MSTHQICYVCYLLRVAFFQLMIYRLYINHHKMPELCQAAHLGSCFTLFFPVQDSTTAVCYVSGQGELTLPVEAG